MHGAPLCVAAGEILWGKCIMGSLFGGIKPKIDIPIFVKQYLNKVRLMCIVSFLNFHNEFVKHNYITKCTVNYLNLQSIKNASLASRMKIGVSIDILFCFASLQELQLDEFITHEIGFEDINKAFDLLVEGKSLRCTIWMDK